MKKIITLTAGILASISFLATLCLARPTQAQLMGLDLSVSPPVTYLKLMPGDSGSHAITIQNTGPRMVTLKTRILDFQPDTTTGQPVLQDNTTFKYLKLTKPDQAIFTLEPQQSQKIAFTLNIPKSAKTQEHHLTIVFEASSAQPAGVELPGARTQVSGAVGSNLIVLITPPDTDTQPVFTFHPTGWWKVVDSLQTVQFGVRAENKSVAAGPVVGELRLEDWLGNTVARWRVFPDIVLGKSQRPLRTPADSNKGPSDTPAATASDSAKNTAPSDYPGFMLKKPFLIGYYQLKFFSTTENKPLPPPGSSPTNTGQVIATFWALPILILGLVIVGLVIWVITRQVMPKILLLKPQNNSTLK